jgi:hypothetical protein
MTATVDRDQLAVLRRLRAQLGDVEVLEVAHELAPGRSPTPTSDPTSVSAPTQHYQGNLMDQSTRSQP